MNTSLKTLFLFVICFFIVSSNSIVAQPITSNEIDDLVNKTLKTFEVPGIAVAVIKDGKVIHSKGYGVRSIKTGEPVTDETLFGIASNSKAFATATLAMLVDEGKLNWDDRVIDYIPEFRMYNPYVTEDFRIRDLITHRSGLGLGAGDLMFFPDSSNFTLDELIHNLRFLKQVSPFRSKYDYDNLLYMVAGEVVARISGISWDEFVEERIMKPLNMQQSAPTYNRLKDKSNVIDGHANIEGKVQVVTRHRAFDGESPAGGLYSNVTDLSKWVICRLNQGRYGKDLESRLFSEKSHKEMWKPQTLVPVRKDSVYNTHFKAYGLGWFLSDVAGYLEVTHTGGLEGMVTQIIMYPELNLGIIVLTNQQVGAAFRTISNTIKDSYLGKEKRNWAALLSKQLEKRRSKADKTVSKIWDKIEKRIESSDKNIDLEKFIGTYTDNWFGKIELSIKEKNLYFRSIKSPRLNGKVYHYKANTFVVKWKDRSFDADAFMMFNLNSEGEAVAITMKAISPMTDFSYDFHDLSFKREKE